MRARRASSLIELIVTVALLGVVWSVATLALRPAAPPRTDPASVIADSLDRVIASRLAMTLRFDLDNGPAAATLSPDGSVVADTALRIERLTGRAIDAR